MRMKLAMLKVNVVLAVLLAMAALCPRPADALVYKSYGGWTDNGGANMMSIHAYTVSANTWAALYGVTTPLTDMETGTLIAPALYPVAETAINIYPLAYNELANPSGVGT